jgi:hypothetical protein
MPPRDHLPLLRLIREEPRRKRPGFGTTPPRAFGPHGTKIAGELDAASATARARPQIPGIDPKLILKVQLTSQVDEDDWRKAGMHVLAQNPDNILVLFADSFELEAFRARVAAFQSGPEPGKKIPHTTASLPTLRPSLKSPPSTASGRTCERRELSLPQMLTVARPGSSISNCGMLAHQESDSFVPLPWGAMLRRSAAHRSANLL